MVDPWVRPQQIDLPNDRRATIHADGTVMLERCPDEGWNCNVTVSLDELREIVELVFYEEAEAVAGL